jgi:hypothetical protein
MSTYYSLYESSLVVPGVLHGTCTRLERDVDLTKRSFFIGLDGVNYDD